MDMELQRIDSDHYRHLTFLDKRLLDGDHDHTLQQLVVSASVQFSVPICFISMPLKHSVVYLAHTGLPSAMDPRKKVLSCDTYCQFVVSKDELVEFPNISSSTDIPQQAVEKYGINSYFGFPLHVNNRVVGSFALMDFRPWNPDSDTKKKMLLFAMEVEARLSELEVEGNSKQKLIAAAMDTGFQELTNALIPLLEMPTLASILQVDLLANQNIEFDLRSLSNNLPADKKKLVNDALILIAGFREMGHLFESLESAGTRVLKSVISLRATSSWEDNQCMLNEAVLSAVQLSYHSTKIVCEVEFELLNEDLNARYKAGQLISVISLILNSMSSSIYQQSNAEENAPKLDKTLKVSVTRHNMKADIRIHSNLPSPDCWQETLAWIDPFLAELPDTLIRGEEEAVIICWPLV
ncbi:MAG: GAF domain-containing protein [Pedobacter sp.]|nr:MAG: GAF domain-containing protein [Pedobacter sp.]